MHALFHIHQSPDSLLSAIVAILYDGIYPASAESNTGTIKSSESKLCKLLFVLGQGAICSLVYIEKLASVFKKEKDRRAVIDKDAMSSGDTTTQSKVGGNAEEHASADSMEAEMGMAAAADAEHEQVVIK